MVEAGRAGERDGWMCTAGGVVAHAVGGSFFVSFCWCGMVVGHLLGVILFLLIFESSFLGERLLPLLVVGAFALVWYGGVTIVGFL